MEIFIGIALLLPISALAIQAYESDLDDDRCDFLWKPKEITGMEDPSIEPKNYNNMPNPIEMKIIRFFAYREDDGTSLIQ